MHRQKTYFVLPLYLVAALSILLLAGCYTFKGTSIAPDVNTFYVYPVDDNTSNAPVTLGVQFAERLRDKIRAESRLSYREDSPDLEFRGSIIDYRVTAEAPQAGQTVGLNKLILKVRIQLGNTKDEKQNWQQDFERFVIFSPDADLLSEQDRLILELNNQLVEDIFRRAFTNW